jgi:hypothetical protein
VKAASTNVSQLEIKRPVGIKPINVMAVRDSQKPEVNEAAPEQKRPFGIKPINMAALRVAAAPVASEDKGGAEEKRDTSTTKDPSTEALASSKDSDSGSVVRKGGAEEKSDTSTPHDPSNEALACRDSGSTSVRNPRGGMRLSLNLSSLNKDTPSAKVEQEEPIARRGDISASSSRAQENMLDDGKGSESGAASTLRVSSSCIESGDEKRTNAASTGEQGSDKTSTGGGAAADGHVGHVPVNQGGHVTAADTSAAHAVHHAAGDDDEMTAGATYSPGGKQGGSSVGAREAQACADALVSHKHTPHEATKSEETSQPQQGNGVDGATARAAATRVLSATTEKEDQKLSNGGDTNVASKEPLRDRDCVSSGDQQRVNVTDGDNQDAGDADDVKVCCMCSTFGV